MDTIDCSINLVFVRLGKETYAGRQEVAVENCTGL
jgi:hypothetical protein